MGLQLKFHKNGIMCVKDICSRVFINTLDQHLNDAWSTLNWLIDLLIDTLSTLNQQLADSWKSATQLISSSSFDHNPQWV